MATHSSILAWKIPRTQRSLVGYSPWGCRESDMTDCTHTYILQTSFLFFYAYVSHIDRGCFQLALALRQLYMPLKLCHRRENASHRKSQENWLGICLPSAAHWFSAIYLHGPPKSRDTLSGTVTHCGGEWQQRRQALPHPVYPGREAPERKKEGRMEEEHGKGEQKHKQLEKNPLGPSAPPH